MTFREIQKRSEMPEGGKQMFLKRRSRSQTISAEIFRWREQKSQQRLIEFLIISELISVV